MAESILDARHTAVIVIDLQKGIAARDGAPHGSATVVANTVRLLEDAMTGLSAESHAEAIAHIFPRLGKVRRTDRVVSALGS
jgi:nicotinamidase-related amidase